MKKHFEYETPECSVICFDNEDIVTTSGGANNSKLSASELNALSQTGDVNFTDLFGL